MSSRGIDQAVPQHVRHMVLVFAVAGIAFFTNLGATDLWDEDEGFFAGTAAEMFSRHEWIVPYFNGQLFSHKPPLMYWSMMLGFEAFGVTPFAARVGSAIFGIATAVLTYRLGRRLFCAEVGLFASLIICSSLMFDVVARAATPDSYLVFFMTLSLYLFTLRDRTVENPPETHDLKTPEHRRGTKPLLNWKLSAALYAAMGVAVLVKGPIGVLLPMAAIGLYLLCTTPREALPDHATLYERWLRNLLPFGPVNFVRCLWAMRPLTAIAVVALTAGPWFFYVGVLTHGRFLAEFFGVHNFGRFLHPMESHHGSLLYYPIAILVGFFPWSVFVGPTVIDLIRRIRSRDEWSDACILLLCWVAVVVGFFSLAGTKLPNYVLPAYPALALLTACFLHRWMNSLHTVPRWQPRACFAILGFIGLVLLIGFPLAAKLQIRGQSIVAALGGTPELTGELPLLGLLGVMPLAGAAAAIWFGERGKARASVFVTVIAAQLLTVGILAFASIRINEFQYAQKLANIITDATGHQPARIAQYRHSRPTFVFYVKQPVEMISDTRLLPEFFGANHQSFLITTSQSFPDIQASLPTDVVVLAEQRLFPKRGTVLVLGRATRISGREPALAR